MGNCPVLKALPDVTGGSCQPEARRERHENNMLRGGARENGREKLLAAGQGGRAEILNQPVLFPFCKTF